MPAPLFARMRKPSYLYQMGSPQKSRAPRRRRIAAFWGLAAVLTYSAASAQADADWLETALQKTLRLSSPWELPLRAEFDSAALPDASAMGPVTPVESTPVLELPWGSDSPDKVAPETKSPASLSIPTSDSSAKLGIRLVDEFEDPWLGRETEDDLDEAGAEHPSGAYLDSDETGAYLIDPWAK